MHERLDADAAPDDERADALGPADLVRCERDQIGIGRVQREPRQRLHRIGMEARAGCARDLGTTPHRLDRADLVVGVHHAHDCRLPVDGAGQRVYVEHAAGIDRNLGHPEAVLAQPARGVEHCMVLDRAHDDPVAALVARAHGHALKGDVVCFRAARREHDLVGARADGRGDDLARFFDGLARLARGRVEGRRIREPVVEVWRHRRARLRPQRRSGRVVEVDGGPGLHRASA